MESKGLSEVNLVRVLEKMKSQEAFDLKTSKNNTDVITLDDEVSAELKTNDTASELSGAGKYNSKEERSAELDVLCSEIEEIFASDDNLLYRVMNHIKTSKANNLFKVQVSRAL